VKHATHDGEHEKMFNRMSGVNKPALEGQQHSGGEVDAKA
jgi:hypothetical protein